MKELTPEIIVKKYPNLFRDYGGDMRVTCMAWGLSVGAGWLPIIDSIGQQLKDLKVEDKVIADQVKEKFGGLRFYYHTENLSRSVWDWWPTNRFVIRIWFHRCTRWIRKYFTKARRFFYRSLYEKVCDIIETAEEKSYITCESCGSPGKLIGRAWLKTLCDDCDEERNK